MSNLPDIHIGLLIDHADALPELVNLFEHEWAPYYGPGGPGDALSDLRASCNRDQLPIAFVAKRGDSICGTASLKSESITTHRHLRPWLAGLVVMNDFREMGVGRALVRAVEAKAVELGFSEIFSGASPADEAPPLDGLEDAARRQMRFGESWEFVERVGYDYSDVEIYRKQLG